MNNQVKLIDESKMLEWIDTMYNKKLPDELKEYRNGRQVVLDLLEIQIKSGCFAPDTPPVPTIKPGDKHRCPCCNIASTQQEWDESTNKAYNGDAATIHDCKTLNLLALFVCPACGEQAELHQMEVVE